MSDENEPIRVKRILVSLDNSMHSMAALQAAVELAQHYNAELKGVFIEDTALLRLAEMPFCQEVGEYTAIVREISTDGLSRGIYVQSRRVIRSFRNLINQTDLTAEIFIRRGNVNETIDEESQKSDLIVIGRSGTNPLGGHRLGSTAAALIRNHNKPLLLIEENNRLGYPMLVYYENSPLGQTCLETARDLLNPEETLVILLHQDDPEAFSNDTGHVKQWSARHSVNISIQAIKTRTITRFFRIIEGLKTGLLILPHALDSHSEAFTLLCLEKINLPTLLIRN